MVGNAGVLNGTWSISDDSRKPNSSPSEPPKKPMVNAMMMKMRLTSTPENPVAFNIAMESIFS